MFVFSLLTSHMCVCVQVSQLTCALTPAVRPSLSVCSITGRSCRVTPKTPRPNPSRLWARHANARAWRRAFPHLTTSWTNYNRSATHLCSVARPRRFTHSFPPALTSFPQSSAEGLYRAQTPPVITFWQEIQVDYVNLIKKINKNWKYSCACVQCFIASQCRCWLVSKVHDILCIFKFIYLI